MTRILVAHHNPSVTMGFQKSFEQTDLDVVTASILQEMIEQFVEHDGEFDLIVLDLEFGPYPGAQVIEAVRDRGFSGPILIATVTPEDGQHLTQAGATEIVHLFDANDRIREMFQLEGQPA